MGTKNNKGKDDIYHLHSFGVAAGGLLIRGLAQKCPKPPMVNLVSYGAPANGIFGIPNCEAETESYELCELARDQD